MCHPVDESVIFSDNSEQRIEIPGSGRTIPTYAYGYSSQDRKPVVLIIHDIFGANPFYRDMGKRLADQGFAALLPDLFCREGALSENTREAAFARGSRHSFPVALEDIRAMVDKLSQEGHNVGLIGFCMGGTLTLLSAGRIPEVKAGVVYYGFPVNAHPTPNRPDNPIDEVAQLQAPLLGFFGEADAGVGVENVKAYEAAAQKAGKQIDFTIYPVVGHGFLTFDKEGPAVKASQESWSRAITFFKEHLGAKVSA